MSKKNNTKIIIGICVGCIAAFCLIAGFFGYKISKNTKEAKNAASGFISVLQTGDLKQLEWEYYAYSAEDTGFVADENGVAQARIMTKQQLADKYGTEVMRKLEEDEEPDVNSELLGVLMKHSLIRAVVPTTFGNTARMTLHMEIPDMKGWLLSLSNDDLAVLASMSEGKLEDLDSRMESGEIMRQPISFSVPMIKQNNKWRFQVTEEMEQTFFGGLYNLFDQEGTEAE